jgi:hypothetical protein
VRCGAEVGRTQRTGQRELQHGEGDREGEKDRSGGTAVVIVVIAGARSLGRDEKRCCPISPISPMSRAQLIRNSGSALATSQPIIVTMMMIDLRSQIILIDSESCDPTWRVIGVTFSIF